MAHKSEDGAEHLSCAARDAGWDEWGVETIEDCRTATIAWLRAQLAQQAADLAKAERENAAWRALVGRFRFHAPYQTLDTPRAWRCHAGDHRTYWQHLAYGNGDTPQSAVIDLATNLGLLDAASQGKP